MPNTLPDAPIAPEMARQKAEVFARSIYPAFFDGQAPEVSTRPINDMAAIPIRFARSATDWIEVGVRGGDGKIGSYQESAFLPESQKKRLARGEAEGEVFTFPAQSVPQISPDGTQVAFCWTKPIPGYPAWWPSRPPALWTVKIGTGTQPEGRPELLATEILTEAKWSPDSKRLAFSRRGEIGIVDLATKATKRLAPPPAATLEDSLIGWKNNRELLIGWTHNGPGSTDLLAWTGVGTPQVLVLNWTDSLGAEDGLRGTTLSPDGQTLAVLFERGFGEGARLNLLPIADLGAKPQRFDSQIPYPYSPVWTKLGIFSFTRGGTSLTSPQSGQSVAWQEPASIRSLRANFSVTTNFAFSVDGKKMVFPAYADPKNRIGWTLFIADTDGQNVRPLTISPK